MIENIKKRIQTSKVTKSIQRLENERYQIQMAAVVDTRERERDGEKKGGFSEGKREREKIIGSVKVFK